MQALDLNLASRPFRNNTLPWVGLVAALVLLLWVSVWNVQTYRQKTALTVDLEQQQVRLREELKELDKRDREAQRAIEKFDLGVLSVRADKANEVIRWKAFSWTRLFNQMQDVQPNDVQMVSIYPTFRLESRRGADAVLHDSRIPVRVEGMAKTLKDFLELERRLISDPHFDRVEPGGTQVADSGEMLFDLKFLYDPRLDHEDRPATEADEADGEGSPEAGSRPEKLAAVAAPTDPPAEADPRTEGL